ncbi:DUF3738 domain-containing protein [Chitinophaga oryzae]|uniref:DUF3738 domain-containing protein n=1 Tax=Chitinophaga oryzae TaxID=2725414 RepID=A0AAE7D586_9BACT|nr:redoxin domain-containing protein [Chitinophaga oryzae]QJB29910.1 DUF3738 domain-containing protein [Chitinophaga oryzae]
MKRLIFLTGMLCPFLAVLSQTMPAPPLQIGNQVPSTSLGPTLNFAGKKVNLAGFKGKLLILDFWTTGCSACVAGLSKLDSLQSRFKDSIQIITVTPQKEEVVRKFFATGAANRPPLPTLTGDTVLSKLFPYTAIPHIVWVAPSGRVSAITYAEYLNTINVQAALLGDFQHLPFKNENVGYSYKTPLLTSTVPLPAGAPIFYSALTGFAPGLSMMAGINRDTVAGIIRRYATNWQAVDLYLMALGNLVNFPRNRIILEVRQPLAYRYTPKDGYFFEWQQKHSFCYELRCPLSASQQQLQAYMKEDLNRYLHVNGRMEKRLVKCYLLRKNNTGAGLTTAGGPPEVKSGPDGTLLFIRNTTLAALLYRLNEMYDLPPIIDLTGFTGNIDLTLNMPYADIFSLQKSLKRYGLVLEESRQELEMFIITEKSGS